MYVLVCVYVYIYMCMYMCVYVCMCVCVYVQLKLQAVVCHGKVDAGN